MLSNTPHRQRSSSGSRRNITSYTCRILPLVAIFLTAVIVFFSVSRTPLDDVYTAGGLTSAHGGLGSDPRQDEVQSAHSESEGDGKLQLAAKFEKNDNADVPPRHPDCQTIVFFHIPKTGGESLNELWEGPGKKLGWDGYRKVALRVSPAGVPGLNSMRVEDQRQFLENFFMQAHSALLKMRERHAANGCEFFAFTVIRSPLEWVVSLYDDICHRRLFGHKDSCPQRADMTSKEEMLNFPHRDGITSYLTHGWNKWDSPGPVDEKTVEALAANMETGLDMVALTSDVTRLREYLTARFAAPNAQLTPGEIGILQEKANNNENLEKTIRLSDFTPEEEAQLNATVQMDWDLYRRFESRPRPWNQS